MSTIPTQNPVPSEAASDLKYNSGKIDEFVTSNNHFYTDRFGKKHYTIEGINYLSKQAMLNYGYITKRSFESGNTIINPNDVLLWENNGEYYRWDGDLPKIVSAGSTPESAGGIGDGKWKSIGDNSLRTELKEGNGSLIGYKYPAANSVKRQLNKKLDDSVSILDFGVVGDGVHDDTLALMEALEYCYENKVGINGVSGLRSKITDTIYLPLFEDRMKLIDLDFGGLILLPTDDVGDVFISGKKDNGRWVSCMDDPVMAQNVSNLYVRNLVINNNNVDNAIGRRAFGFKELHINCKTDNLVARNFGLGFDFNNCFYLHSNNNVLLNSEALLSQESIGHKYRNACNLIKIESPIALNTRNGYLFEHGVTGLVMDKASFEAQGVSIVSNGEIFDMTVKDSYLENVGDDRDVCFDFRSYSHVTFSNNYMLPKRAKHLFKHKPFQPRNMIEVQRNNHIIGIDPENYFINKGLSYSVIDLKNTQANASLSNTLYRMSEIGEGVIINKKAMNINAGGRITHISNVVNEYIPGNYSGKYNSGYTYGALHGLYNPIKDIEKGTCSFNTQILYSDMQLLLLNLRIADTNETKEYIGTIWGNTCRKPDGTIDSRVQVINDNGKVSLIISGIKVGNFNIVGGELRVI